MASAIGAKKKSSFTLQRDENDTTAVAVGKAVGRVSLDAGQNMVYGTVHNAIPGYHTVQKGLFMKDGVKAAYHVAHGNEIPEKNRVGKVVKNMQHLSSADADFIDRAEALAKYSMTGDMPSELPPRAPPKEKAASEPVMTTPVVVVEETKVEETTTKKGSSWTAASTVTSIRKSSIVGSVGSLVGKKN